MKDSVKNKMILFVLSLEMLGCFLDQNLNSVVSRFTSLVSFFALLSAICMITYRKAFFWLPADAKKRPGGRELFLTVFRDTQLWIVIGGSAIAMLNLVLLHSNKGAFLTAADVLMASYLIGRLRLSKGERLYFAAFGSAFLIWWYCTVRWYFNFNMTGMIFMLTAFMAMLLMEQIRSADMPPVSVCDSDMRGEGTAAADMKEDIPAAVDPKEGKDSGGFGYLGFVQVVLYIVATLLCLLYHARCVLFGMLVFGALYLLMPFLCAKRSRRTVLSLAATLGGVLFTLIYMAMGAMGINATILYKDVLSGRQYIWSELWEAWLLRPITGVGSSYRLRSFFIFEVHNGMFDILTVHGFPVFVCVVFLLSKRIARAMRLGSKNMSRYSRISLAAGFAILFTSFFENFFINSPYLVIMMILFDLAGSGKLKDRREEDNSKADCRPADVQGAIT